MLGRVVKGLENIKRELRKPGTKVYVYTVLGFEMPTTKQETLEQCTNNDKLYLIVFDNDHYMRLETEETE